MKPTKSCARCAEELPIEAFDRDASKPDGYKSHCKKCRAAALESRRLQQAGQVLQELQNGLIRNLAHSKPGGPDLPHIAEVCQSIIHLFGGVDGMAQQFLANYIAAKPGSLTRERMLSNLMKMNAVVSDSKKVEMPVELMSDQDLQAEIEERKKRLMVEGECTIVEDADGR